jgi:hypothetical protein
MISQQQHDIHVPEEETPPPLDQKQPSAPVSSHAYKDEVQPAEKTPAGVENTTDAYQYPPQHKKSKPHVVLFIIATVCFGVGLLSLVIYDSLPPGSEMLAFLLICMVLFAFISGAALFLLGLAVYFNEKYNEKYREYSSGSD